MDKIKLTIDNKPVEVAKGTTIFQAARQVGINIPALCYMKLENLGVENRPGACRICVVEVEGRRNLAPSCSTDCTEGMVVKTTSPRVLNAQNRYGAILSDHLRTVSYVLQTAMRASGPQLLGIRDRTVENAEVLPTAKITHFH